MVFIKPIYRMTQCFVIFHLQFVSVLFLDSEGVVRTPSEEFFRHVLQLSPEA